MDDEKTIYAIACGQYSDKYIEGYCTTRELAEKVVALRNKSINDDYRVEELDCLDDIGAQIEHIYFRYRFRFVPVTNGWSVGIYKENTTYVKEKPTVAGKLHAWQRGINVTVVIDTHDSERAKKIAIDTFYQWRAENQDFVWEDAYDR